MKNLVMFAAICAVCAAQALTLAEARGKISECIADPKVMTATMKELSPADQAAFVAEVNGAIAGMPGSTEAMVAAALNVNKAAMLGASKGNVSTILAEVYATVPAEALPTITESFATDLFSRSGDASVTYSDEQFQKIATTIMAKISERMASVEGGDARATCAAAMMVKAAGDNPPASLVDAVVATLPESAQPKAKEQIASMTSSDATQSGSYDAVVEAANADNTPPEFDVVLRLAGTQQMEVLLADINAGGVENNAYAEFIISQNPYDGTNIIEPTGYQNQTTH